MPDLHARTKQAIDEYIAGPPHGEARQKAALRRIALIEQECEREECAKVCEEDEYDADSPYGASRSADAIRRRGKP